MVHLAKSNPKCLTLNWRWVKRACSPGARLNLSQISYISVSIKCTALNNVCMKMSVEQRLLVPI